MSMLRKPVHVVLCLCAFVWLAAASEYRGRVTFNEIPVPGATITMTRDGDKVSTISDAAGYYSFPDLRNGVWNIEVEMSCFAPIKQSVIIWGDTPPGDWQSIHTH